MNSQPDLKPCHHLEWTGPPLKLSNCNLNLLALPHLPSFIDLFANSSTLPETTNLLFTSLLITPCWTVHANKAQDPGKLPSPFSSSLFFLHSDFPRTFRRGKKKKEKKRYSSVSLANFSEHVFLEPRFQWVWGKLQVTRRKFRVYGDGRKLLCRRNTKKSLNVQRLKKYW